MVPAKTFCIKARFLPVLVGAAIGLAVLLLFGRSPEGRQQLELLDTTAATRQERRPTDTSNTALNTAQTPAPPKKESLPNTSSVPVNAKRKKKHEDVSFRQHVYGINLLLLDKVAQRRDRSSSSSVLPYDSAILCVCAKCGSTSFYNYLYRQIFGVNFQERYSGPPWIQNVQSKRWEGVFQRPRLRDQDVVRLLKTTTTRSQNRTFGLAMIRHPVERIISAWKSKLACDPHLNVDLPERAKFVHQLRAMAGPGAIVGINDTATDCLGFSDYLKVLQRIHQRGKASELDNHFLPQHLHCFRHTEPADWTVVVTASDPSLTSILATLLGENSETSDKNAGDGIGHRHKSGSSDAFSISSRDQAILDEITRDEMELLSDYLSLPSL